MGGLGVWEMSGYGVRRTGMEEVAGELRGTMEGGGKVQGKGGRLYCGGNGRVGGREKEQGRVGEVDEGRVEKGEEGR